MITDNIILVEPNSPDSTKIYMDRFQNVSPEVIDACRESNRTQSQVFADLKKNALDCMKADLRGKLGKIKNWFDLIYSHKYGGAVYETYPIASRETWYGKRIEYSGSEMQEIIFKECQFVSDVPTTATVKIWDLYLNTEILSKDVALVQGNNIITLSNTTVIPAFPNGLYFVAIKFPVELKPTRFMEYSCGGNVAKVMSAQTTQVVPLKEGVVTSEYSFLNLKFEVRSSFDNVIEKYSSQLLLPLAYKCQELMYKYALGSEKASRFTLVNRDAMDIASTDACKEYDKQLNNMLEIIYNDLKDNTSMAVNPETRPSVYLVSR